MYTLTLILTATANVILWNVHAEGIFILSFIVVMFSLYTEWILTLSVNAIMPYVTTELTLHTCHLINALMELSPSLSLFIVTIIISLSHCDRQGVITSTSSLWHIPSFKVFHPCPNGLQKQQLLLLLQLQQHSIFLSD